VRIATDLATGALTLPGDERMLFLATVPGG
jgi:hypothetical protein